jgi:NAD-dependent deacetylase
MGSEQLGEMIRRSSYIVAFTGAGISADSGIPTYRGSGGVWNQYDPDKYANVNYFFRDPAYYWNFFKDVRYPSLKAASPNAAHEALAGLERRGRLKAVITQNIDGLHQEAGSSRVLELHGNTRSISCLHCGHSYGIDEVRTMLDEQLPPPCRECGGMLKPDVVLFGESLPMDALNEAGEEARTCDLFLSVGSSLVVQPAASMPAIAKRAGASLVIVNKDETPLDSLADLIIRDSASSALAGLPDG